MQPGIEKLVKTLLAGTMSGTIDWETTNRSSQFRTLMRNGAIAVDKWSWSSDTGQDGITADITVYNIDGERIDSCQTHSGNDFLLISELHEAVRRKVFKVDQTLESLMQELQAKINPKP